jgi:hypothetical protein
LILNGITCGASPQVFCRHGKTKRRVSSYLLELRDFLRPSFRNVSAKRARRPVLPPAFFFSRAYSATDFPAFSADLVKLPGS